MRSGAVICLLVAAALAVTDHEEASYIHTGHQKMAGAKNPQRAPTMNRSALGANTSTGKSTLQDLLSLSISPAEATKPISLLLLGVDSRTGEPARSDSIMLVLLNPLPNQVHIVSIPRDTYVDVPGNGKTKINHAMTYGGAPLVQQTVEKWLGVKVDETVVADFSGFQEVVDLLGGVTVNVEKDMHYDDPTDGTHIHLHAGRQTLDGKKALDYARFRYDPEADTGRMRRQQQVIKAMLQKALSLETLPKLISMKDIIGNHLHLSLSAVKMLQYANSFRTFPADQIHVEVIKGMNRVAPSDGLWYFFVEDKERERIQGLLSDWSHASEQGVSIREE